MRNLQNIVLIAILIAVGHLFTACSNCTKDDYIHRITDDIRAINLGDTLKLKNNLGKVVYGICDKKLITYPVISASKPKEYCSTALVRHETADWRFNYGVEPIDDKLTKVTSGQNGIDFYFGDNVLLPHNNYINVGVKDINTYWGQSFKGCGTGEIKDSSPRMIVYSNPTQTNGVVILRYQYITNTDTLTWDIKKFY